MSIRPFEIAVPDDALRDGRFLGQKRSRDLRDAEARDGLVRIASGPHEVWLTHEAAAPLALALEDGWVSPSYGVKLPSTVVTVQGTVTVPFTAAFGFAAERSMPICARFS